MFGESEVHRLELDHRGGCDCSSSTSVKRYLTYLTLCLFKRLQKGGGYRFGPYVFFLCLSLHNSLAYGPIFIYLFIYFFNVCG